VTLAASLPAAEPRAPRLAANPQLTSSVLSFSFPFLQSVLSATLLSHYSENSKNYKQATKLIFKSYFCYLMKRCVKKIKIHYETRRHYLVAAALLQTILEKPNPKNFPGSCFVPSFTPADLIALQRPSQPIVSMQLLCSRDTDIQPLGVFDRQEEAGRQKKSPQSPEDQG